MTSYGQYGVTDFIFSSFNQFYTYLLQHLKAYLFSFSGVTYELQTYKVTEKSSLSSEKMIRITEKLGVVYCPSLQSHNQTQKQEYLQLTQVPSHLYSFLLIWFTRLISFPQWNHLDQIETEVDSRYQSDLFSYPVSCKCHGVIKPSDTTKQFELQALPTALTRQQSWRKKVKEEKIASFRHADDGHGLQDLLLLDPIPPWINATAGSMSVFCLFFCPCLESSVIQQF